MSGSRVNGVLSPGLPTEGGTSRRDLECVCACESPMMGCTRDGGIYSKGVLVDGRERAARGMSGSRVGECLWKSDDGRHAGWRDL